MIIKSKINFLFKIFYYFKDILLPLHALELSLRTTLDQDLLEAMFTV